MLVVGRSWTRTRLVVVAKLDRNLNKSLYIAVSIALEQTNEGLAQDPGKVGMTRAARGTTRWRRTPPDARHVPPARLQRARDHGTWSWTWRRDAACRNLGSSLFFAPDGEPASARRRREAAAKAVCARCPVQMPCALYALTTHQSHGVWGGLAEDDRRQSVTDEHRRTCAPYGQP